MRLYKALVLSILLYAEENWTLLVTNEKALKTFHMNCQPRILDIRWYDF